MIRRIGYCFLWSGSIFVLWSVWLYCVAPVDALKDRVFYAPPYNQIVRQAGLGVADNLSLEQMPAALIFATIAQEDPDFINHHGIMPVNIYHNIIDHFRYGNHLRGGSTLTQQLVKNVFTGADHTLYRKYVEMIYSFRMEHDFTKEEIFTLYANIAETGPGVYGYQQAAELYFHKPASQLSDTESAFIVSNLPSPKKWSAWFRDGVADPMAFQRIDPLLNWTRIQMASYNADHLTESDKRQLFSVYMRAPGNFHRLMMSQWRDIQQLANRDTVQFILSYRQDNPAAVGTQAPSGHK